jgi:uncharacterized membrane protein YsdA (DUF1294 family)
MLWDKNKAKNGGDRTPEKRIFKTAALGAAGGILIGMYFFRHKTMKAAFKYGIPVLFVLNLLLYICIFWLI